MRQVILTIAVLVLAAGCGTKECKDGTLFVEVTRSGAAATANAVGVTVTVDGVTRTAPATTITPRAGMDSLAIEFPTGYPAGKAISVSITALLDGVIVASTSTTRTLTGACDRFAIVLDTGVTTDDMGFGDGGDPGDGGDQDFAGCVPSVTSCPATVTCGRVSDGCGGFVACAVPCKVSAVTPRLANTDHVVTFDGTFTTGATVDFPGAMGVALTLQGSHRATAQVPATATAGALTVHSGSTDLPAGAFRRAAYVLSAQDIDLYQPQLEGGKQNPSLNTPRHQHGGLVIGGALYLFGGNVSGNGSTPTNEVESMRINGDGTLGAPVAATNKLASARMGAATILIGSRVYVIGGRDGTTSLTSLEYATVMSDGTLSAFTQVTNALTTARAFAGVAVIGDAVYLVGGNSGALDVGTVERAVIGADDSLGAFAAVSGVTVKTGRSRHAMFVSQSALIVAGGAANGAPTASIEVAPIDANGVLGDFAAAGSLPAAWSGQPTTQWGTTLFAYPYTASLSVTGAPGAFTDPGAAIYGIPSGQMVGARATVVRDTIYITGGTFDGAPKPTVARMGLGRGASLGGFTTSSTISLPESRGGAGGAVIGDTLYILGGTSPTGASAVVYQATINPDDTLGPFTASTSTLATPVTYHGVAVLRNRVFVLGGAGSPSLTTVQSAPIGVDGKLGAFAAAGTALTIGRQGFGTIASVDSVCVVGGYLGPGLNYTDTYECSTVAANGTPSAFAQVTDASNVNLKIHLATTRGFNSAGIVKGGLVAFGGTNGSPRTAIESVGMFNWPSQAFNPTTIAGITASRSYQTGLAVGDWLYLFGDSTLTNTTIRANAISFNTGFAADATTALGASLYGANAFLIGNRAYVIGGIASGGNLAAVQSAGVQ